MEAIILGGLIILGYALYLMGLEQGKRAGRKSGREQGREEIRRVIRNHYGLEA